jgi:membrane-associated protein
MLAYLMQLGQQLGTWWYVLVAFLVFGEAAVMIGLVLPSETALLVAGFAAQQGWIVLPPMIVLAVAAAVAGDAVGYEIGRRAGPRLLGSRLGGWVGERRWRSAEAFLHRHGGRAVLLGRFAPVLRTLVPGLAGVARIPYARTFLPWNVTGAVLWATGALLLGYGFAASLPIVGQYLTFATVGILLVLGLYALAAWSARRRTTSDSDGGSSTPDERQDVGGMRVPR